MELKIVDQDGEWVTNPHFYPFHDPETKVVYAPGWAVKVKCPEGSWLAGQMAERVIIKVSDPLQQAAAPPPKAEAHKPPSKKG